MCEENRGTVLVRELYSFPPDRSPRSNWVLRTQPCVCESRAPSPHTARRDQDVRRGGKKSDVNQTSAISRYGDAARTLTGQRVCQRERSPDTPSPPTWDMVSLQFASQVLNGVQGISPKTNFIQNPKSWFPAKTPKELSASFS